MAAEAAGGKPVENVFSPATLGAADSDDCDLGLADSAGHTAAAYAAMQSHAAGPGLLQEYMLTSVLSDVPSE